VCFVSAAKEDAPPVIRRSSSTMALQRNRHSSINFRKVAPETDPAVGAKAQQRMPADDILVLEEYQVMLFFFPERNLLISMGDLNLHSPMVEACRDALQNRKSAVLSDLLGDTDGSDGCGTLMVVMLDATMDMCFPILDVYGDALEGLRLLTQANPVFDYLRQVVLFPSAIC